MAKFCGNCGAQMDDTAKICGMCGVPFPDVRINIPGGGSKPGTSGNGPLMNANLDSTSILLFISNAVMFFILGILNFTKVFKRTILGYSEKFSMTEVNKGLTVLIGIIIFLSAVAAVVPIFVSFKTKGLIISQISISGVAFCFIIIMLIAYGSSEEAVFYNVSLSFGGWLYILLSLTALSLSIFALVRNRTPKTQERWMY